MLTEFIDFVDSILPSVSPDFRDNAKNAILQFEKKGKKLNYLMPHPLERLSQGDIISRIPFSYFDENGSQKIFSADAFVLSTSCHIDQKDKIILAPILPLNEFKGNEYDLKNNLIFDYMYFPDLIMADKFIDFEFLNTYNKNLIEQGIADKKIHRIASLNQMGYYFFVVKLTVYFMRKEDDETLRERDVSFFTSQQ